MLSGIMNRTKQTSSAPLLGVDIGRVIIEGDGPDTSFLGASDDDALRAPAMAGAFESLARLCDLFDGRVWLVSKCGPKIQDRSRRWLARHRFFERTGIWPIRLRFCRDRREKAPICHEIGIDFFVDDRLDVLRTMAGIVDHRVHFGAARTEPGIHAARSWAVAEAAITQTFNATSR